MSNTLKITHDGTLTVMKAGCVIVGNQSLGDILYSAMGLDETTYSEMVNAHLEITIVPKPIEPVVRWIKDADE